MDHLDDISIEELQEALDEVNAAKPAQRLLAAIAYKNGITQTELAEWYGVQRRTIYSWLKRLDDGPLDQAVVDAPRSGRPRKLTTKQRQEFEAALHESPTEVGYDEPAWTPALVGRFVHDAFGVEYSEPSCRRLMKEAGLEYRVPPRPPAGAGSEDESDDRGSGQWTP
ncbi:transposase [Halococcus salifodinae DSM 8989]|uniref:Transposase n=1 Tax=Halococcus salifodinae DSM 8989 TaxID=1227456 RepID=M0N6T4_9EURY|nr:transposase [Halococcus salifodinae DSM 8989]